ncbi:MAG: transcription elongation factor GreA [Parcubacteria group bacterium Gr01-1014_106]|nr:MAG: transcription elongation factor GreA [Parcubacteria group bacterium Gr01-1014_106]
MNQKKTLITEEGLKKLQDELHALKTVKRREVADAIQRAKEQGDLSENAEYVEAKEAQGHVEQRIAELEASLKNVEVIQKNGVTNHTAVAVGDTVTIRWNGDETSYTIVGANEADPAAGKISNESPVGTALLGKRVGDTTNIRTPSGVKEAHIVRIA